MKTPTQMKRLSASSCGITPSATLSATALATACCAGPNICTACLAPLIVTLLNKIVGGLHNRFGATTASNVLNPSLLLVRAFANAVSAALPRGPMIRSIWATSLPSPTSDSPTHSPFTFAIAISSQGTHNLQADARSYIYPCFQHPDGQTGPVSQIAAGTKPASQSQSLLRTDGKMVRSRCAKRVATVRSALVPGLMAFSLSAASQARRAGRTWSGSSAACKLLANLSAAPCTQ